MCEPFKDQSVAIRISSGEEYVETQKQLFTIGCGWYRGCDRIRNLHQMDSVDDVAIVISPMGTITVALLDDESEYPMFDVDTILSHADTLYANKLGEMESQLTDQQSVVDKEQEKLDMLKANLEEYKNWLMNESPNT